MKNQYFGDVRDLFKYDLILRVIQESRINCFTFIPMLTRSDGSTDGGRIDYGKAKAGTANKALMGFLKKRIDENRRDIKEIKGYFRSNGIRVKVYKEAEYLDHKARGGYFKEIPKEHLSNSLIFVDPDNGLEVRNSNEKHVLYSEVKGLYDRMDGNSILMVYQHFPRVARKKYLDRRSDELERHIGRPVHVSDNGIVFFFLAKRDDVARQLGKIASRYKRDYPGLV